MGDLDVDDGKQVLVLVEQCDVGRAELATENVERTVAQGVDVCRLGVADHDFAEGHGQPVGFGMSGNHLEPCHPVIRRDLQKRGSRGARWLVHLPACKKQDRER